MFGIVLPGDWAAIATLAIVAVTFVLFVRERQPPEVIAIGAAAVMMLLGLLPYDEAVSALSNAAPWTIAFMFIIMGGLLRTGALDVLASTTSARPAPRPSTPTRFMRRSPPPRPIGASPAKPLIAR